MMRYEFKLKNGVEKSVRGQEVRELLKIQVGNTCQDELGKENSQSAVSSLP